MSVTRFEQESAIDYVVSDTGELLFENDILPKPRQIAIHYIDINSSFRATSPTLVVRDRQALNQQISNLFSTPIGSEVFEPTYGSDLPLRLFEPVTDATAWLIQTDSFIALDRWMSSRLAVNYPACSVTPHFTDNSSGYIIQMPYEILSTRVAHTYSAFLAR